MTNYRRSREEIVEINEQHWDAWTKEVQDRGKWAKEIQGIADDPDHYLKTREHMLYPYLTEVTGRRVIVLQFGSAQVLLACALKGAEVTGVDFSSEKVSLAKEALGEYHVVEKLIKANCQDLPPSVPRSYFDIAVAECGVLIWIPDLDAWMSNAFSVLKDGGLLLVQDFHPISSMVDDFVVKAGGDRTIVIQRSYLDQSPEYFQDDNLPLGVNYIWKLADVVNAAIGAGFQIRHLEEFYDRLGEEPNLLPNKFLLVAERR
jgi:ubiquinone/menaquinone biosynthesis C-methylase UbiE